MESKNYFGNYTLSQTTLDKLKEVEKILEPDKSPVNPAWAIIKPKQETRTDEPEDVHSATHREVPEVTEDDRAHLVPSSTQSFFPQQERAHNTPSRVGPLGSSWNDVAESLYESLENTNGTLSLVDLTNLPDTEVDSVVKYLSTKLSLEGTFNLCHFVCAMNMDQSMVYIKMICNNLLLQKIIDLQEPSRLMSCLIHELVDKFPEDILEFIYIPMLSAELRDTTTILAMISSFPPERKIDLITNFQTSVQELKEWHVNILSQLITVKLTDNATKEKLLNLLLEKASTYSRDKNYGKVILSFLKLNPPFTEDQKSSLSEIVAVNETIFKRAMESLLKNMYFRGDLWHIT